MTVLTRWDPFREFSTLQDRMNRLFRDSYGDHEEALTASTFAPPVDVYEDEHNVTLKIEVPGIDEKDIDVRIENNLLTVHGERKFEKEEKEEKLRQGIIPQAAPPVVEIGEEFKQGQQEILNKVAQQQESFVQIQQVLQKQHEELIGVLGEVSDAQTATRGQQGQGIDMLRQAIELLQALAARSGQPSAPAPLPIPEPAPSTPGPAPKGRDKLVERLRAIDAKIPAVGRQSRHD